MSIDKTKCCKTHTEEKEESGECCQTKSIHELAMTNPTKTYRELEQMKEQNEMRLLIHFILRIPITFSEFVVAIFLGGHSRLSEPPVLWKMQWSYKAAGARECPGTAGNA
jgi:hypothetical protein